MAYWEEGLEFVPLHMHEGLRLYIQHGIIPGDFLLSILANDFPGAVMRADYTNSRFLKEWASYVACYLPSACHGSEEAVKMWSAWGGLDGINARKTDAGSS